MDVAHRLVGDSRNAPRRGGDSETGTKWGETVGSWGSTVLRCPFGMLYARGAQTEALPRRLKIAKVDSPRRRRRQSRPRLAQKSDAGESSSGSSSYAGSVLHRAVAANEATWRGGSAAAFGDTVCLFEGQVDTRGGRADSGRGGVATVAQSLDSMDGGVKQGLCATGWIKSAEGDGGERGIFVGGLLLGSMRELRRLQARDGRNSL